MKIYGLLITKDDEAIFAEWCREQLRLYDAVICLDGSQSDATARIAGAFAERLVYVHEREAGVVQKTDHGLRRVVHREIVRRFGVDNWVMCCHADEFCYHDPRKIAQEAVRNGYDQVSWYSLHFYPHPSELADWQQRVSLPLRQRIRHYHWNYSGTGLPWREDRLYRNGASVSWDETTHGSVHPHGTRSLAPFHPILLHYKVFTTDLNWYQANGTHTLYRSHWAENQHRTGLPFRVERPEDLFVASIPKYGCCDRLEDRIEQPWNMGEQYRPERRRALKPLRPE